MNDNDPFPSSVAGGYQKSNQFAEPNPHLQQALDEKEAYEATKRASKSNRPSVTTIAVALATGLFVIGMAVSFVAFMPRTKSDADPSEHVAAEQSEQVQASDPQESKGKEKLKNLLAKIKEKKAHSSTGRELSDETVPETAITDVLHSQNQPSLGSTPKP